MAGDRKSSEAAGSAREPRATGAVLGADSGVGIADRHIRIGWWALLVFLVLGTVLEAFHGFKVQWYLAATNDTRRHLWTLAHAHGTLLALVNIAFGLTLRARANLSASARILASRALLLATALLPGGFFLGGVVIYAGDPGLGVLLVPMGAAFLALAVLLVARGTSRP